MKKGLRDLPPMSPDLRCGCGAPTDDFRICVVSGHHRICCDADPCGRDGDKDGQGQDAWIVPIHELQSKIRMARRLYFLGVKLSSAYGAQP